MLFLGIDRCFKTKLKDRGIMDPDLGTGLAYMVDKGGYAAHLEATTGMIHDKLVRVFTVFHLTPWHLRSSKSTTCGSDLHAVNQAYTHSSKGYLVTGVVAVSCRHSFIRPTGIMDLQKGEK